MARILPTRWALVGALLAFPLSGWAESLPEGGVEGDGGLMEEFAFLEEELSAEDVVSASRHRQSIFLSASAITVITREDIQSSGATSLAELLRRVPGMDIYRLKASYTLVGARALTYEFNNKVLLLIDGREELVELTGFALWNSLSIDLDEIERIEIIRGPGSALYGANALSAVINVTTMAERPEVRACVSTVAGETGLFRVFARGENVHKVADGMLSYRLGLGYEQERSSTDIRDRSLGVFRTHGYVRYQEPGGLDVSLHGGFSTGDSMIYLFVGDARLSALNTPWIMAKADYRFNPDVKLSFQAYYQDLSSDILVRSELTAFGVWLADIPDLSWSSDTADLQTLLEWKVAEGFLFIGGANLRYSTLAGKNIITDDDDELRGAGIIHVELSPWEFFQLTLGLRLDANDLTGMTYSPRVVAVIRAKSNHAIRVGYGVAFRKPSFLESRFHLDIQEFNSSAPEIVDVLAEQFSNKGLKNLQAQSLEAGWRGSFLDARLWLKVDLFYNIYQNRMAFNVEMDMRMGLPDLQNGEIMFKNLSKEFSMAGGEAEVAYRPTEEWFFLCNLGFRHPVKDFMVFENRKEPTLRFNLGTRYVQEQGLLADVFLHGVSDYNQVVIRPNDVLNPAPLFVNTGDMLLLVARLGYRAKTDRLAYEIGLLLRAPLTENRHEYPGLTIPPQQAGDSASDFAGEPTRRQLAFYFQASL